jgi:antitoxin FitA
VSNVCAPCAIIAVNETRRYGIFKRDVWELHVGSMTIRNIDDELKERLRVRAARNGRSMEEEARTILRQVVGGITGPQLVALSRQLFSGEDGVELELPERGPDRPPVDFTEHTRKPRKGGK